jgi:hypothetical protein
LVAGPCWEGSNLLDREALPRWPDDEGAAGSPVDMTTGFSDSGGRVRDTVVEVLELAQLEAGSHVTAQADRSRPGSSPVRDRRLRVSALCRPDSKCV